MGIPYWDPHSLFGISGIYRWRGICYLVDFPTLIYHYNNFRFFHVSTALRTFFRNHFRFDLPHHTQGAPFSGGSYGLATTFPYSITLSNLKLMITILNLIITNLLFCSLVPRLLFLQLTICWRCYAMIIQPNLVQCIYQRLQSVLTLR